jgi:hypothetical protein
MKYHVTIETPDGRRIKTWGVCPVGETKILDGIYDPDQKRLSLIFDSITEQYTPIHVEDRGKIREQVRKLDTYYKFHLPEEDLDFFLDNYVDNNFTFVLEAPKILLEHE